MENKASEILRSDKEFAGKQECTLGSGKRTRRKSKYLSGPYVTGEEIDNLGEDVPAGSSVNRRRGLDINEDSGAGLLLKFTTGFPLPSNETLIPIFKRFGLLKESKIQVFDASTTRIMYERISDTQFAFRSLERTKPFGESLPSFNLHGLPADDPKTTVVRKRNVTKESQPRQPSSSVGTNDVGLRVQKVEWMKSFFEKAGDTVSPEKRAQLEIEIKGFLG